MEILKRQIKYSQVDHIVFQLKWILPQISNEKELIVLAYVYLYKDLAPDKLVEDKQFSAGNSVNNYISDLRKKQLIIGKKRELHLHPGIFLTKEPIKYEFELYPS